MTIRASDLFKLCDKTRMLLSIIFVSIEDVISFTIITIYMLFSIGVVTNLTQYPNTENIVFTTGNLYAYTMGAEFDAPGTGESYVPGEWTVFVILKFIIDIVVFNILIAILSDSFDQVKMDQYAYDTLEIIGLLLELNKITVCSRSKVDNYFIHVIKNVTHENGS